MNSYFFNQIRRADLPKIKKAELYIVGALLPRRLERMWRRHAVEMQNQLNANNFSRHGFYVTAGRLSLDGRVWVRYGHFDYRHP